MSSLPQYSNFDWEDYLKIIEKYKNGYNDNESLEDFLVKRFELELRGLAYEGYLLREKIFEIKRSDPLRTFLVVENLSYGAVALAPITVERGGQKYIVGSDIPVISAKVESRSSHSNEFVFNKDLFAEEVQSMIIEERPNIVVVDGSNSVDESGRVFGNIPDAYKGYRNYFLGINIALTGKANAEGFMVDSSFIEYLKSNKNFNDMACKAGGIAREKMILRADPYKMLFWYPGSKNLYLREFEPNAVKSHTYQSADNSKSEPKLFICQSNIEKEALDAKAKEFIGLNDGNIGLYHSCFFDDTDFFKSSRLHYTKDHGLVLENRYVVFARKYFRDYLDKYCDLEVADVDTIVSKSIRRLKSTHTIISGRTAQHYNRGRPRDIPKGELLKSL